MSHNLEILKLIGKKGFVQTNLARAAASWRAGEGSHSVPVTHTHPIDQAIANFLGFSGLPITP
jgi:hypothetical protein